MNLTAHYRVCRALTPAMTERRWGRIVIIGSVNARAGRPGLVAYSTAKAGLQGFTRSLARELGPHGVCVNTVLPGAIQVNAEHHVPARHRTTPAEQNFDERSGPEFARDDRGEYQLEEIPLTTEGLDMIDLKPEELADAIREAIADGRLNPAAPEQS
ncbi:SDR family NAD(P)-dependent oxidoreductase [Streptomyces kasugaensis]|uniref:SDR family NAD(P)-dependent oxidoreductase n=1 Tax=Streptomyces kasugaensis TaxID=1946 RepID=UPI001F5F3D1B|nr:SDR family NAD(P)-dependent oxidoreductase [Streptomyces kasugaensis]